MSGNFAPVDYSINPAAVLASGKYNLFIIGVNWGGPANYTITVTTDGKDETFTVSDPSKIGVWSPDQVPQITVD